MTNNNLDREGVLLHFSDLSSKIWHLNSVEYKTKTRGCGQLYFIDKHDSGYLGMALQLYAQAHLGHYHFLTQKEYSQKLMAQLKSMPLLTYICIIRTSKHL